MSEDNLDPDASIVTLTDEAGRSLMCFVEQTFEIDDQDYLLLMPVDNPIQIFAWQDDEDSDDEVLVDVTEEDEIDQIFDTAKAVLAEQDLTLQRTALTLTAAGDLPEVGEDEDDIISLAAEDEDANGVGVEPEEFLQLATFFYDDQEYMACTPLDPLLFFARGSATGEPKLLSPEEFAAVQPQISDKLFDVLED
jgi:hypothetical protein